MPGFGDHKGPREVGDPPSAWLKGQTADLAAKLEWEAAINKAYAESQAHLVKQRDGLVALLDEAQSIMSREPGLDLETRQHIVDWGKRCNKALREFGQ